MKLPFPLCSLLHRSSWRFARRKATGPDMLGRQRHVGIYCCGTCGTERRIVGGRVRLEDAVLPVDAPPPVRGLAMRLHQLLGGPVRADAAPPPGSRAPAR